MPTPGPDPVDDYDGDDADKWKHDDPTETSPRQRQRDEQATFDANQRWLYKQMSSLYDQIQARLRHPWRQP